MKISYAVTVCNEFEEIKKLVNFLLLNKREDDEIVILFDYNNGTTEVLDFLREKSVGEKIIFYKERFINHFADWKNKLTEYCSGDYIFQIDADEIPHKLLMVNLPIILENNPDHEVYLVPRVNTVEGLTESHIKKWGWQVNNKGWVNYPDYQYRIWKNKPEIKWKNKVHEVLEGHKNFTSLPSQEELSLYHPKTIERQEKQNEYYNTL
jgi:hypothetical protein